MTGRFGSGARARRLALAALLGAYLAPVLPEEAAARPGGGHSYRSGSSRSSSTRSSRSSRTRSSRSSSGSSRVSGGSTSTSRRPAVVTRARAIHLGSARLQDRRSWAPGAASLYGAPPPRPAELNVEQPGTFQVVSAVLLLLLFAALTGPLLLIALVLFLVRRARGSGWSTAAAAAAASTPAGGEARVRRELAAIRALDPDFSLVLFADFLGGLYVEAHAARGRGTLDLLAPYLMPAARATLAGLGVTPVPYGVVGAIRPLRVSGLEPASPVVRVSLEIEACYGEGAEGAAPRSYFAVERWHLLRHKSARSRPPERVRVYGCPGCGAPLDRIVGGACGHCQRVADGGALDWQVEAIEIVARSEQGPMLTGTAEERGTELPTVRDPELGAQLAALREKDPAFDEAAFFARVGLVFQTLQVAWSSLEWERARPFLSDHLHAAQGYWIAAYRAAGLRNVTQNARIQRLEMVRVGSDRWFDAVTVRLWATGLDYTVRVSDGAVVGGSNARERAYTEYWTLIRGTGRTGPTRSEPVCPSCGAPLQINMAGVCGYCGAKVNSGAFDWVLSRIEQDDAYAG